MAFLFNVSVSVLTLVLHRPEATRAAPTLVKDILGGSKFGENDKHRRKFLFSDGTGTTADPKQVQLVLVACFLQIATDLVCCSILTFSLNNSQTRLSTNFLMQVIYAENSHVDGHDGEPAATSIQNNHLTPLKNITDTHLPTLTSMDVQPMERYCMHLIHMHLASQGIAVFL